MRNKKKGAISLPSNYLVLIILALVAGGIIIAAIKFGASKTDELGAELMCHGSVAARQKLGYDVWGQDVARAPLLCKTLEHEFPRKEKATKEDVMLDFAKDIERCWWMFGEGYADKVFSSQEYYNSHQCFACYITTMKEWEVEDGEQPLIQALEFYEFLSKTPKDVVDVSDNCKNNQGYCIEGALISDCQEKFEDETGARPDSGILKMNKGNVACQKKYEDSRNNCCYSTSFCVGQGGQCIGQEDVCGVGFQEYDSWSCPGEQKCCVREENYVTPLDYINEVTPGQLMIGDNIVPNEIYAVTYGGKIRYYLGSDYLLISGSKFLGYIFLNWGLPYYGDIPKIYRKYFPNGKLNFDRGAIYLTKYDRVEEFCTQEADIRGVK